MRPLRWGPTAITTADGEIFAAIEQANLAHAAPPLPTPQAALRRIVCWSGWPGDDAPPGSGTFPRDFRTWTPAGRAALASACKTWRTALSPRGVQLCLRPHARHILSDVQGTLAFLRSHPDLHLVLDPASLFAASMLQRAEDHLARIFESLGSHRTTVALLLANVERCDPDDPDALRPAPLRRGLIDPALILRLWREHIPPTLPVALLDAEFQAQAALLS
jgi:hypothetical protein